MLRKLPGKCIFCEAGKLSKEHFWSEWASPLLPSYPINQHVEQLYTFTQGTKLREVPRTRIKPGHARTKKVRVVCTRCNNGWMNNLETAARPFLTPLISTASHTISIDAALWVTRWVALKIMVGEHNQPGDAVTPFYERARFRATLQVPDNFRIWIARCGVDGWQTAYLRHAATVSATPVIDPEYRLKNIHSVTFGVGDLLIHSLYTTVPGINLDLALTQAGLISPLFPFVGDIAWPPIRSVTAAEATILADTL